MNLDKKGTGETRGVEHMFLPILKLVEILSGMHISERL